MLVSGFKEDLSVRNVLRGNQKWSFYFTEELLLICVPFKGTGSWDEWFLKMNSLHSERKFWSTLIGQHISNTHTMYGKLVAVSRRWKVDSCFKHFIEQGRFDSILGSYSVPGIDFVPITHPKIYNAQKLPLKRFYRGTLIFVLYTHKVEKELI